MKNKELSIIIPIYNVEQYLTDCLESILKNRHLDSTEVILVNDGSTDNSGEICQKYLNKNPNLFKYLKTKNSGLSEARNNGLKISSGNKIWFVDGDDMISQNAIETITNAEKHDILMINYSFLINNTINRARQDYIKNPIHRYIINTPIVPIRIFDKQFLTKIKFKFKKDRLYEDSGSMYNLVKYTEDIHYINQYLYIYRKRENSITTSSNILSNSNDRFWAANEILNNVPNEFSDEKNFQVTKTIMFYSFDIFNAIRNKRRAPLDEARLYLEKNVPEYYNNKYLKRKNNIMRFYRIYLVFLHKRKYLLCKILSSIRNKMI